MALPSKALLFRYKDEVMICMIENGFPRISPSRLMCETADQDALNALSIGPNQLHVVAVDAVEGDEISLYKINFDPITSITMQVSATKLIDENRFLAVLHSLQRQAQVFTNFDACPGVIQAEI